MEIRRLQYYIVINCVVIIPYLAAKPFSLNEAIAAESKQKQAIDKTTEFEETNAKRFYLNESLRDPLKSKHFKATESLLPRAKKISSLKYKKAFQINSPLKPKKLKYTQSRLKRRNQSIKQKIVDHEKFNHKYVPVLKSLSVLLDNLLARDSSSSLEIGRKKNRLSRHYSEERDDVVCKCTRKSDTETAESKPAKETVTFTTPGIEVSTTTEAPTAAAHHSPFGNFSSIRQDKNLPLLLAGDTSSNWGNDNGLNERSSPAFHRGNKGNITRNHRNSEYNTECGEIGSSSANDEEDSCNTSRDNASSDGLRGRVRGNRDDTRNPIYRSSVDETNEFQKSNARGPIYRSMDEDYEFSKDKNAIGHFRGDITEFEGENKLETGRDEAKSARFVPKSVGRFRGFVPEDGVDIIPDSVQSKETDKESIFDVSHLDANDKRFVDRHGALTEEDQKISPKYETLISNKDLYRPTEPVYNHSKTNMPLVTIIDGYSVARDKNGKNKIAEKTIRIHS